MNGLNSTELIVLLLSISVMLISSRVLAELGKRWKLPVVMGELFVGILLGPTVLGLISPETFSFLFPPTGNVPIAMDGIFKLSVVMLLFVAGMEVQLPLVLKQGKVAISTSFFSMIIPFATGFAVAWYFPELFGINAEGKIRLLFALFLGTALSISALPVIVRILMDMNLFKTNVGMVIVASAMFNDLFGWLIFSVVLSMAGQPDNMNIGYTILWVLGFGIFMLTIGKKIIDRILPWVQNKLSWPGGVLSGTLGLCLLCAAFTESIHIHAILGAFIAGIAIGDSVQLHERAREIIHQFVTNFFAPLFFVSIGLKLDFVENFNPVIVGVVLLLSFAGKVLGAYIGARLGGMGTSNSLAVGFGMNARGAMEIILGTLAYQAGLISQPIFVALVVMALVTSLSSGPLMRKFVKT
ncbi:MAG: cation:proton antiporter [Bacteroidia bacterium]|nr:cation:proton antiporter [Bacteroidia bacterium]